MGKAFWANAMGLVSEAMTAKRAKVMCMMIPLNDA